MQISSQLLKKFINIQDSPENISKLLTQHTCQIDGIKKTVIPKDVVIGKVINCKKHPNADKLTITQVDCGDKWKYQIVTGADNINEATIVAVALPGCTLPAINLTIVDRNMRGEESNGMICSKEELWIKEDLELHNIWNLSEDMEWLTEKDLGIPLWDKYPWLESFVLDINNKNLSYRADLTGHWGQAVELFTIYTTKNPKKILFNTIDNILKDITNINILDTLANSEKWNIQIDIQSEWCRAYTLLEINNVNIARSSFFQRLQLIQLDSTPRNNFVDFSNIFMHSWGQPIHFFDADKIKGKVIVREAIEWEKFIDLTDKEHILHNKDLVIADEEKVIWLAGIIWWKNTAINENTKNILVEIGNFDNFMINNTMKHLSLDTDAWIRFEKNINPAWSLYSLLFFLDEFKRNTELKWNIWGLNSFQNEDISKFLFNIFPIDLSKLKNFIWDTIDSEIVNKILSKFGFSLVDGNIKTPIFRSPESLNKENDIFTEISRIYGYDNIKTAPLIEKQVFKPFQQEMSFTRKIENKLVKTCWFDQVETNNLYEEKIAEKINYKPDLDNLSTLKTKDKNNNQYLRNNFFLSHLKVLEKNFREFEYIKIVELDTIYQKDFWEKKACGFTIYRKKINNWSENNIFEIKNAINEILDSINIKWKIDYKANKEIPSFHHPKQQWEIILNGKKIWEIFTLNPYFHQNFKFPQNSQITCAILDINILMEIGKQQWDRKIEKLNYSSLDDKIVNRDLSFIINKNKDYSQITNAINKIKEIIKLEVFDLYDIDEENKSISLNIQIKGEKLTSDDVNKIMNKAIENVEKNGGKLRI